MRASAPSAAPTSSLWIMASRVAIHCSSCSALRLNVCRIDKLLLQNLWDVFEKLNTLTLQGQCKDFQETKVYLLKEYTTRNNAAWSWWITIAESWKGNPSPAIYCLKMHLHTNTLLKWFWTVCKKCIETHFGKLYFLLQACKYFFSLSYIRPGTRFDLTCNQFGQTEKGKQNVFQRNKIT